MSAQTTDEPDVLLKIRTLRILFGDGRMAELRSVLCPAQQRVLALEHCLSCEDSGGLVRGEDAECASCRAARAGDTGPRTAAAKPRAGAAPTSVSDLMTMDVFAVRPDANLDIVLDVLIERGFGGAPVVVGDGQPIGVVSRSDVLGERFPEAGEAVAPRDQFAHGHSAAESGAGVHAEAPRRPTAADAMTRGAFTLPESALVWQAAALMNRRGIHRVIIVSDDGRVAGIVTSSDIVRWVADQAATAADR